MIQILGLRKFIPKDSTDGKEKIYDAFFKNNWRVNSISEILADPNGLMDRLKIPKKERWNLFYTIAHCNEGKREFKSLSVLAFDLDGIDKDLSDNYTSVVCKALGVSSTETGVINSGNGLHFIIGLTKPIDKPQQFKELKPLYNSMCGKINAALEAAGLKGGADPTIFEARRLLRFPYTENRKVGKPAVFSSVLQPNITAIDFDMHKAAGVPKVGKKEQIDRDIMKKFTRTDPPAVMSGCDFLKWCKNNKESMNEPQWYAALSITSRLSDATTTNYSYEVSREAGGSTDEKIDQAMAASGPRTCDNINNIWDGCKKCANFEKVNSPILILGPDAIPTEFTGFHNISYTGKEKPKANYKDLRRFFEREHFYKGLGGSGMVQIYKGSHYQYKENKFLEQFAQKHFNPYASNHMVREFRDLVTRTNLEELEWFEQSTLRKINFRNGYLNIDTMEFKDHTNEVGFRYVLPYDYNPTAKAPTFLKMLSQVTGGDSDTQKVLEEFMGYCLTNDRPWAQKSLVLVGGGANGKSTFMDVLKALAGEDDRSPQNKNYSSLTIDDINKSEYNRQMLDGKLFNISEETPTKALVNNSLFKSLVTGGEVQVRSPYKEPYFIRNRAKLVFSCNELPSSPDNTFGYYRRLIIIAFEQLFTKDMEGFDPHIELKLLKELSGIFNIALEGYRRLVKQKGFTAAAKVEQTLEDYRLDNDTVMRWFRENVVVHENGGYVENFAPIADLYLNYKIKTEEGGERPVTKMKFFKQIALLVPRYRERSTRATHMSRRVRGLQGISCEACD